MCRRHAWGADNSHDAAIRGYCRQAASLFYTPAEGLLRQPEIRDTSFHTIYYKMLTDAEVMIRYSK